MPWIDRKIVIWFVHADSPSQLNGREKCEKRIIPHSSRDHEIIYTWMEHTRNAEQERTKWNEAEEKVECMQIPIIHLRGRGADAFDVILQSSFFRIPFVADSSRRSEYFPMIPPNKSLSCIMMLILIPLIFFSRNCTIIWTLHFSTHTHGDRQILIDWALWAQIYVFMFCDYILCRFESLWWVQECAIHTIMCIDCARHCDKKHWNFIPFYFAFNPNEMRTTARKTPRNSTRAHYLLIQFDVRAMVWCD